MTWLEREKSGKKMCCPSSRSPAVHVILSSRGIKKTFQCGYYHSEGLKKGTFLLQIIPLQLLSPNQNHLKWNPIHAVEKNVRCRPLMIDFWVLLDSFCLKSITLAMLCHIPEGIFAKLQFFDCENGQWLGRCRLS